MKLSLYTDDLLEAPADLLAVGVFSDEPDRGLAYAQLNRALDGALEKACRDEDFKGRIGQRLVFNVHSGLKARRVLVFGYGERPSYEPEAARRFAGATARVARSVGAASCALVLTVRDVPAPPGRVVDLMQALAEGVVLGDYHFDVHKTKEVKPSPLKQVRVAFVAEDVQGVKGAALRDALERGQIVSEAVRASRDLTNEPANLMTPSALAEHAKKMAKSADLGFKLLGPKDMDKQGMGLLLGVGRGSEHEPKLIDLFYEPDEAPDDTPKIALIGKGLTFDSGGLSLKPADSMVEMKCDMAGAACVFGAMKAVAALRPTCSVHGIIAAAENMPDGKAIRPGDVLKSKKGLTVEVTNTDAEGRLVLADAIAYALEHKPTDVIDVATLTGATVVALGKFMAAAFVDGDAMAEDLEASWTRTGEKFWRMPLDTDLREMLNSEVADIKNVGERPAGAITAALFLREFIDSAVGRWAHLDIAGPVMAAKEVDYVTKGGTGFGVRTLVDYVMRRSAGG